MASAISVRFTTPQEVRVQLAEPKWFPASGPRCEREQGRGGGAGQRMNRTGGESHGRVDDAVVEGGERGRGGEQQQRAAGHQGAVGDHVSARGGAGAGISMDRRSCDRCDSLMIMSAC